MHLEGDFGVLRRLFYKRKWLEGHYSHHRSIRPLLLILSGTMRGVYGGGQVIALKQWGLTNVFDVVVAVSTGAPTAAYFLAGQPEIGTTIYFNECTTQEFISFRRGFRGGFIADVDYLASVFRGERSYKKLNQSAVFDSRSELIITATCADTGAGLMLGAKYVKPDIVEAIRASIALPGLSHGDVRIDGIRCCDGAGALPFPVRKSLKEYRPTDVLVLANRPRAYSGGSWLERQFSSLLMRNYPKRVQEIFAHRRNVFASELNYLRTQTQSHFAILWSDDVVGSFTRTPATLESAAHRAQNHLEGLLKEAHHQSSVL